MTYERKKKKRREKEKKRSFFVNDTATTEIYTLSLHDALPISLLKHYPNNALTYFLTEEMLVKRGLREVTYGIESLEETKSVDSFKLSMGYEKQPIRQKIVFRPLIDLALRTPGIGRAVQWMGTRKGAPSYWRKAYGLLNFAGRAGDER